MNQHQLYELLEFHHHKYNSKLFIEEDPILVPHLFKKPQDIEIAGLLTAVLAWGIRKTIINKSKELMGLMDNSPHDFILNHQEDDLRSLHHFKHRTFNYTDLLYFIHFLKSYYQTSSSLEELFIPVNLDDNIGSGINNFYDQFISDPFFSSRTKKHVASPSKKSACKRICMFLRWMVRRDDQGVDFGIWKRIKMSQLVCPCDIHVEKTARKLKLVTRKQVDWLMAEELTENLKKFDGDDPVKYDFALFSMGLNKVL